MWYVFLSLSLLSFCAFGGACPDGYVTASLNNVVRIAPDCDAAETDLGNLVLKCDNSSPICMPDLKCSGASTIHISDNAHVSLYAAKHTSPAIYVGVDDQVCYLNLVPGNKSGTVNVVYNNRTYHVNDLHKCLALNSSSVPTAGVSANYSVRWTANVDTSRITGISNCSSNPGSFGYVLSEVYISGSADYNKYCWCRMVNPATTAWGYAGAFDSRVMCNQQCAQKCATVFSENAIFRNSLISVIAL